MSLTVQLQRVEPRLLELCMKTPWLFDLLLAHPEQSLYDIMEPYEEEEDDDDDDEAPRPVKLVEGIPFPLLRELEDGADFLIQLEEMEPMGVALPALLVALGTAMPEERETWAAFDVLRPPDGRPRELVPSARRPAPEVVPHFLVRRAAGLLQYFHDDDLKKVVSADALDVLEVHRAAFASALDDAMTYEHRVIVVPAPG